VISAAMGSFDSAGRSSLLRSGRQLFGENWKVEAKRSAVLSLRYQAKS